MRAVNSPIQISAPILIYVDKQFMVQCTKGIFLLHIEISAGEKDKLFQTGPLPSALVNPPSRKLTTLYFVNCVL